MSSPTTFSSVLDGPQGAKIGQCPARREVGIVRGLVGEHFARQDVVDIPLASTATHVVPRHPDLELAFDMRGQLFKREADQFLPRAAVLFAFQRSSQVGRYVSVQSIAWQFVLGFERFRLAAVAVALPKFLAVLFAVERSLLLIGYRAACRAIRVQSGPGCNRRFADFARYSRVPDARSFHRPNPQQSVEIIETPALGTAKLVLPALAREGCSTHSARRFARSRGEFARPHDGAAAGIAAVQVLTLALGELGGTVCAIGHTDVTT